ncbi:DJ-1/PfpI family protein [uncultured Croceitalea sp.]|uniref:DJ-1/PfpI family protein n=1 Tax=uncultured Croceitalea sp. TaxID=1798908 RepID=UPI0033068445
MKKSIIPLLLLVLTINATAQKGEIKNIAIYLQKNAEILDFAGPMEVFIIAGFNVYTVAETTEPIRAMHAMTVIPDYSIDNAPIPDIITFVGGGDLNDAKNPKLLKWTKKMASNTELQFSVCTGAFFLAEAGLLDGMTATTFHSAIPILKQGFSDIDVRNDVRFVDNGNVITTAGISAGIDGAFHLVSKLKGTKYAQWVADAMEYDKWVPNQGLVLTDDFSKEVMKKGFAEALQNSNGRYLYNGELLDLADKLEIQKEFKDAEKVITYVIDRMAKPDLQTYEYLRNIYEIQGKEVPPTSSEFLKILKTEGLKSAERLCQKTSKKFQKWVYLDLDEIFRIAYLDYYDKGDLKTAMGIAQLVHNLLPKDPYANYVMGLYHERNGDLDKAMQLYKKSLDLDPNFYMAQEKIDSFDVRTK